VIRSSSFSRPARNCDFSAIAKFLASLSPNSAFGFSLISVLAALAVPLMPSLRMSLSVMSLMGSAMSRAFAAASAAAVASLPSFAALVACEVVAAYAFCASFHLAFRAGLAKLRTAASCVASASAVSAAAAAYLARLPAPAADVAFSAASAAALILAIWSAVLLVERAEASFVVSAFAFPSVSSFVPDNRGGEPEEDVDQRRAYLGLSLVFGLDRLDLVPDRVAEVCVRQRDAIEHLLLDDLVIGVGEDLRHDGGWLIGLSDRHARPDGVARQAACSDEATDGAVADHALKSKQLLIGPDEARRGLPSRLRSCALHYAGPVVDNKV
jgi:hypothetical protein